MKKSIFKLIGGLWCIVSTELSSFTFRSCPGSTNVKTVGYSEALKQLFVEFQNNKRYIYDNAPQVTWDAFIKTLESQEPKVGSVLAELVKGVLGYREVTDHISIQASTPEAALKQMEEQLKNIQDDYKAKVKAVEDRMAERLEKIKFGKKTVSGYLYGIPDHQTKRMMFYDKYGELIESRDLLPDEMQGRLFNAGKKTKLDEQPFETNINPGAPGEPAAGAPVDPDGKKLVEQINPTFTPVQKNDEKRKSKGLKQFEHNEDGWSQMNDEELIQKYGTTDISVIRTMQQVGDKWLEPKDIKPADLQKANADKNKKEKPLTDTMKEYIQTLRDGGTLEKPNSAVIHSLKAKGILDANSELTHFGKTCEL